MARIPQARPVSESVARLALGSVSGPVLGIETSCDETAAAVVADGRVLGQSIATQIPLHRRFGGVVPEVAARNHLLTILPTIEAALEQANVTLTQLSGIAVTNRPGLIGALLVGVQTARALAWTAHLPLVGVDHIAAHVWAITIQPQHGHASRSQPQLPYAALAVSGGHTSLYRVDGPDQLLELGRTLDDAAGEAFDKFGKLLGMPYPAGPQVDQLAAVGLPDSTLLPRGMLGRDDGAYSFSGLKTAVRLQVEALHSQGIDLTGQQLADLCASFQAAVVEQLVRVTMASLRRHRLHDLVVAGGVAANRGLRLALAAACHREKVRFWPVPVEYCGDNAAMVAALGAALLAKGHADSPHELDAIATGQVRRTRQTVAVAATRANQLR
ncbi:MAG: tRNA (adenosine(37)-N6)-threonylcarbamoyltransferase complex transferase subunit TsaD [Myxococcales bacterium]|nr:tRNA (adenosine(37)-N6)-threonylcarbamoyltransferase complex transferase subunit TsaD [Myxococcales bacterium]